MTAYIQDIGKHNGQAVTLKFSQYGYSGEETSQRAFLRFGNSIG